MHPGLHKGHHEWGLAFTLNICFIVFALRAGIRLFHVSKTTVKNLIMFCLSCERGSVNFQSTACPLVVLLRRSVCVRARCVRKEQSESSLAWKSEGRNETSVSCLCSFALSGGMVVGVLEKGS